MSLKDRILKSKDRKSEIMEIPEWDGVKLEVRGMSGRLRARFIEDWQKAGLGEKPDQAAAGAVIMPLIPDLVVDGIHDPESGEKVFDLADVDALGEKDGEVLQRVALQVIALSGLGGNAVDDAGKSSSPTEKAASGSN